MREDGLDQLRLGRLQGARQGQAVDELGDVGADHVGAEQLAAARVEHRLHEAVALEKPDVARFLDANRLFHEAVTQAAQSPRLGQILVMLVEQPVVLHTAREYSVDELRQSARDHDELIAAFRARDPRWARAVMGSHLRRAFHVFADAMWERRSS